MRSWTRKKGDPRWIEAKYGGSCSQCEAEIHHGDRILYWPRTRTVMCEKGGVMARLPGGLYRIWKTGSQRFVTVPLDKVRLLGIPDKAYAKWHVPAAMPKDRLKQLLKSRDVLLLEVVRPDK